MGVDGTGRSRYKLLRAFAGGAMVESARARRLPARARDPRLLAGILLVLGATILGAWLFSVADDSVEYWTVSRDVRAGDEFTKSDLVATRAALRGDAEAAYLRVDSALPSGDLVWAQDHSSGALVGAASLEPRAELGRIELPLAVGWGSAPDDLAPGDRVDVWVGPGQGATTITETKKVMAAAQVAAVGDGNAASGAVTRTVVVRVDSESITAAEMRLLSGGRITLVRTP